MQDQAQPTSGEPRKGLAIASLVLGIIGIPTLGLLFVGGIAGIILGTIALNKAKSNPAHYAGRGLAIAGIVMSSLSMLIAILGIIVAIAIPNLIRAQQTAREMEALGEVVTIGHAQVRYSVTKGRGKYTDLRRLGEEGLIDSTLASGQKGGYVFSSEPLSTGNGPAMFDTTARPVDVGTFGTGKISFGSNETLQLYESEGSVELKGTPGNRVPAGATPVTE